MKKEFLRSVISREFHSDLVTVSDVMKPVYKDFLKILYKNLDDLVSLERNAVKRHIIQELQRYFLEPSYKESLPAIERSEFSGLSQHLLPQITLEKLNVGGFRGFRSMRGIPLHEKMTIFYAENGSGKSSLCDALEFALTGDVEERKSRKCTEAQYFQNKHVTGQSFADTTIEIVGDTFYAIQEYQRCFIEKNRIDTFGRLKECNAGVIQKSLADLLGFGDITDLIRDFVGADSFGLTPRERPSFNDSFIDLLNWEIVLVNLREQKEKVQEQLEEHFPDLLSLEEEALMNEIRERGIKLKEELKFPPTAFDLDELKESISVLKESIGEVDEINKQLLGKIDKLDSLGFFEAATKMLDKLSDLDTCPLCDTPLDTVKTSPRDKTKSELHALQGIKTLKEKMETIILRKMIPALRAFKGEYAKLSNNFSPEVLKQLMELGDVTSLGLPALDLDVIELSVNNYADFKKEFEENITFPDSVLDEMYRIVDGTKKKFDIKTIKIVVLRENITALKNIRAHNARRLDYEKWKYLSEHGYRRFRGALTQAETQIVQQEADGMNSRITGFYQALNKEDNPQQWVDAITLPATSSEHIMVSIQGREFDALSILSEGHLRTLGVSILLARAFKFSSPFLIFDDAVNAIDSDHRENVVALLKGESILSDYFGEETDEIKQFVDGLQMIVTSHEDLFDKLLVHRFTDAAPLRYVLTCGEAGVMDAKQPRDYLQLIQKRIDESCVSEAAHDCRRWIDDMAYRYAGKFGVRVVVGKEGHTYSLVNSLSREANKAGSYLNRELSDESKGLLADICKAEGQGAYNNPDFLRFWQFLNTASHGIEARNSESIPHLNSGSFQQLFNKLKNMNDELRRLPRK